MVKLTYDKSLYQNISNYYSSVLVHENADKKDDEFFNDTYCVQLVIFKIVCNENRRRINLNFDADKDYDKEVVREFDKIYMANLKYLVNFPDEILESVADLRVFALGVVSNEVKQKLKNYCNCL